jgi:hypothetical protein
MKERSMPDDAAGLIVPEPEAERFVTDLVKRILRLAVDSEGPLDVSLGRMRDIFGLEFTLGEKGRIYWGTHIDEHFGCTVSSFTYADGERTITVSIQEADPTRCGVRALVVDPDSAAVSAMLGDAGFAETALYGSHGARAGFEYRRGEYEVTTFIVGESDYNVPHKCVRMVSLAWRPTT